MKKYLLLIALLLIFPLKVNAIEDASIILTTSNKNINVNDTINITVNIKSPIPIGYYEYTLDYNKNKLKLISGTAYNVNRAVNDSTTTITKTFKFQVIDEGTSNVNVKSYVITNYKEDKNIEAKATPITITTNNNSNYSNNNYLSKLEIEGYKLSPEFKKETENYTVEVDKGTKQINVIAETEDKDAKLTGDGKFEITAKEKEIELTVTSKQGEKRTYKITIQETKREKVQIEINGKTYTVIDITDKKIIPKNYESKKIKLNNIEIIALYNKNTNYTLIGVKDEKNNIELYIYEPENKKYTLYQEFTFDNITFIPLETEEKLKNYQKEKITIKETEITCYKLNQESKYCIIYGMNSATGEKGWYTYNIDENTLQKNDFEVNNYYEDKIKNTETLIYILTGTTLFFGITVIALAIKYSQRKNK